MNEVQGVLEVLEGESEGRVALSNNVVETGDGLVLLEVLGESPLATADGAGKLLGESLVLTELDEERLVKKVLDVLVVVERSRGGRSLVGTLLVEGVARVDTCTCQLRCPTATHP